MAEIYLNSNAPVKTKIFWAGEIIDADDIVAVDIYDVTEDPAVDPLVDPENKIATITATKLDNDFGTYQIVVPFSYTNRNKRLKFVWKYAIGGLDGSHVSYVDVVTPYAQLIEAIEDLKIGTDPSDPNYKPYHDLVMAEKYARKTIESYTGQQFSLYNDVQVAYGAGTDILALPFKLSELHEIYADDILLIDNINGINNWGYSPIISETGFALRVDKTSFMDNTVYIANGMVPPTINDFGSHGAFRKNVRYRIQGKFGWPTVPDNIEEAAIILMGEFFSKDMTWKNKYVNKVQTFDWNFEYFDDVFRGTGNLYVDQLLQPYVVTGMIVI